MFGVRQSNLKVRSSCQPKKIMDRKTTICMRATKEIPDFVQRDANTQLRNQGGRKGDEWQLPFAFELWNTMLKPYYCYPAAPSS